jgi:hypothetical protein
MSRPPITSATKEHHPRSNLTALWPDTKNYFLSKGYGAVHHGLRCITLEFRTTVADLLQKGKCELFTIRTSPSRPLLGERHRTLSRTVGSPLKDGPSHCALEKCMPDYIFCRSCSNSTLQIQPSKINTEICHVERRTSRI